MKDDRMLDKRWFVVAIVMKSSVEGSHASDYLCDWQVRLLKASSEAEAHEKAVAIGAEEECTYLNSSGAVVTWSFVGIEDLFPLAGDLCVDGLEVIARRIRVDDPEQLVEGQRLTSGEWTRINRQRVAGDILAGP